MIISPHFSKALLPKLSGVKGFTLIELLIAMAIFAVLAVMAYSGLRTIIATSAGVEKQIVQLEELQRAMTMIEADLRQIVPRAVNTDLGQRKQAFEVGQDTSVLIEFTRGGYPNPAGVLRSSLQRIRYSLDDEGSLLRSSWQHVDYTTSVEPQSLVLLTGVESVEWRFLGNNSRWGTSWKTEESRNSEIPKAIEITLKHARFSEIRRLIPVSGY
ncbi:MAG: Type II secretion system protein GspJ [uncultured Thiotrichaceae bacterium]|uniref:Type II secretion system protein J n=1 Tax=uncultured Thiotrichaceae bacterium TaxID=298394 RepID=A0A6S6SI28_9GAMM|nr:MAG: Type II secretion system protein GspJ [uncultured Thiotrichaceae bacterium]